MVDAGDSRDTAACTIAGHYGVLLLYDPQDHGIPATVDVVCIHGLNGHRTESWTSDEPMGRPGVFWPKDRLPTHLRMARVLTFGYDGAMAGTRPLSHQSIPDIAEDMVAKLTLFRGKDTAQRPILFIAHSVGGIILKQGLITSYLANSKHNEAHSSIHRSTCGIIFMGTPHQGTDSAPWKTMLPWIYSVFTQVETRDIDDLGRDSGILQSLSSQYTAIGHDFKTVFIYETQESSIPDGRSVVIVPCPSAVIPGHQDARKIGRHTDHVRLAKFANDQDDGFSDMVALLREMAIAAPKDISNRWKRYQGSAFLYHPASPCELYTWHLVQKRLGYPLWYPAPPEDLPDEYCKVGVDVGDLGFLSSDGSFDFLFNVCKPANASVNLNRVPQNFAPFGPCNVRKYRDYHSQNTHYVSDETLGGYVGNRTFNYMALVDQGAVMILPDGASRSDLRSLLAISQYAKSNADVWFDFVTQQGMAVGDLYLVTGCDKAWSWGLASYRHPSSVQETVFRFSAPTVAQTNIRDYSWDCSHPVVSRSSRVNTLNNQCLLLRGFSISKRLHQPTEGEKFHVAILDGAATEATIPLIEAGLSSTFYSPIDPGQLRLDSNPMSTRPLRAHFSTADRTRDIEEIQLQSLSPPPNVYHPGQILNQHLMKKYDANIAITHDSEWCAMEHSHLMSILARDETGIRVLLDSLPAVLSADSSNLSHTVVLPTRRHVENEADDDKTSSHSFPHLPPELTDIIILLCCDKPTLLECALVCRGWISTSRRTFFNGRWVGEYNRGTLEFQAGQIRTLGQLLRAPYTTLPHALSHLEVRLPSGIVADYLWDSYRDLLTAIYETGTRLNGFRFMADTISSTLDNPSPLWSFRPPQSLSTLLIDTTFGGTCQLGHSIDDQSMQRLATLISQCCPLDLLSIAMVNPPGPLNSLPRVTRPPLHVTRLRLRVPPDVLGTLLSWFAPVENDEPITTIRELEYTLLQAAAIPILQRSLSSPIFSGLIFLLVAFGTVHAIAPIDLSMLLHLRFLHLRWPVQGPDDASALGTRPSQNPHLENMTLIVTAHRVGTWRSTTPVAKAMDDYLISHLNAHPRLRIHITLGGASLQEAQARRSIFPQCQSSNRLAVGYQILE